MPGNVHAFSIIAYLLYPRCPILRNRINSVLDGGMAPSLRAAETVSYTISQVLHTGPALGPMILTRPSVESNTGNLSFCCASVNTKIALKVRVSVKGYVKSLLPIIVSGSPLGAPCHIKRSGQILVAWQSSNIN